MEIIRSDGSNRSQGIPIVHRQRVIHEQGIQFLDDRRTVIGVLRRVWIIKSPREISNPDRQVSLLQLGSKTPIFEELVVDLHTKRPLLSVSLWNIVAIRHTG